MESNSTHFQYPYLPLSSFVDYLRGQGFIIGVEILQQMQIIIRQLDIREGEDLDLLKTSLCPLFANNKDQQEEFYKAFDKFFTKQAKRSLYQQFANTDGNEDATLDNSKGRDKFANLYFLVGTFIGLLFLGLLGFWLYDLSQENHFETKILEKMKYDPLPLNKQDDSKNKQLPAAPIPHPGAPLAHHEPYTLMISPDIDYFKMTFAEQFRFPIIFFGLGGLIALAIFYLVTELYRWRRKRLVIRRREELDPLAVWPVNAEERIHIYMPEEYAIASSLMQKRLVRSHEGINIPATVVKTARNGGLLTLEYHQHTRPPEYLLLIDTRFVKHLQFDFYNYLFRTFSAQGIRITTFYFESDPRLCFNVERKGSVSLSYLIYHYGGSRLMILSNGDGLLEAQYGENNSWMGLFRNWQDKALLSPRPVSKWGAKEVALASQWILMPASLEGITEMIDAFEKGTAPEPQDWIEGNLKVIPRLRGDNEEVKERLWEYFGDDNSPKLMMQWLAACCIYPELYWELMLFTGKQLSGLSDPLTKLERIHKMISLPWFVRGKIPDQYRKTLLEDKNILSNEQKEYLSDQIASLLGNSMPDNNKSMAYYRRRMFIVSLELSNGKISDARRRTLLAELKKLQELSGEREYSVMRHLNRCLAANFSTIVPKKVQDSLFRGGMLHQGLKTGARAAVFLILAAIVFTRLDFGSLYGDEAHYEGVSYLIDNYEKDASYNTVWAALNYNDGDIHVYPESNGYQLANNYLSNALAAQKDYAAALINLYITEYNKGKLLYNFGEPMQAIALWDFAKNKYWERIEQSLRVGSAKGLHQYAAFRNTFEALQKEYNKIYNKAVTESRKS